MVRGQLVTLCDEPDCIVPAGSYRVSRVNRDGSFHVGGRTAVWPHRIITDPTGRFPGTKEMNDVD